MFRKSDLFWLSLVAFAGVSLFHTSYRVQGLKEEKSNLERQIASEQEGIQVLKAEWSFLNDPVRLEQLASSYLTLKPIMAVQVAGFDALPSRPTTIPAALVSPSLAVASAVPAPAPATASASPNGAAARKGGPLGAPANVAHDRAVSPPAQPHVAPVGHSAPLGHVTLAAVQAPPLLQPHKAPAHSGLMQRPGMIPTLGVTHASARVSAVYAPAKDEIGGLLSRLGRIQ
jgi:hypothetical protein